MRVWLFALEQIVYRAHNVCVEVLVVPHPARQEVDRPARPRENLDSVLHFGYRRVFRVHDAVGLFVGDEKGCEVYHRSASPRVMKK